MAYRVGEIEAALAANTEQFDRKIERAGEIWRGFADDLDVGKHLGEIVQGVNRLADGVGAQTERIEQAIRNMGEVAERETAKTGSDIGALAEVSRGAGAIWTRSFELLGEAAQAAGQIVADFLRDTAQESLALNQQMEAFEVQFATLLGSQGEAMARMQELAEFGRTTPFELPEVVKASRTLEVFTQGALATGEGLRLVGDIAAGTGQEFDRVAFWVGRLYDALSSGRPIGEAMANLQEMGAVSGQTRAEMERLQEEGAALNDIWSVFAGDTGERFGGMMGTLSQTMEGLLSNLEDTRAQLIRTLGEETFGLIRDVLAGLMAQIEENGPEIQAWAEEVGTQVARLADALLDLALDEVDWEAAAEGILNLVEALADLAEWLDRNLLNLQTLAATIQFMASHDFRDFQRMFELEGQRRNISEATEAAEDFVDLIDTEWRRAIRDAREEAAKPPPSGAWDWLAGPAGTTGNVLTVPDEATLREQMEGIAGAYEDYQSATTDLYRELADEGIEHRENVASINADIAATHRDASNRIEEIWTSHAEKLDDLNFDRARKEADWAYERTELAEDLSSQLQDIEAEAAERREEVVQDSAEARIEHERRAAETIADFQLSQEERAYRHAERLEDLERSHRRRMRDLDREIEDILSAVPEEAVPEGRTREDLLTVEQRRRLERLRERRQDEEEDFQEQRQELIEEAEFERRIAEQKHQAALAEAQRRYEAEQLEREEALREIDREAEEEKRTAREKHDDQLRSLERRIEQERIAMARRQQDLERDTAQEVERVRRAEAEKVRALEVRLIEEEARHGAAQRAIREQIASTEDAYTTAVSNMKKGTEELNSELEETYNRAWAAYMMMSTLADREWGIEMSVSPHFRGQSPSPFEKNLSNMIGLLRELDSMSVEPNMRSPLVGTTPSLYGAGAAGGGAPGGDVYITIPGPFTGPISIANREDAEGLVMTIAGGLQGTLSRVLSESNRFPAGRVRRLNG